MIELLKIYALTGAVIATLFLAFGILTSLNVRDYWSTKNFMIVAAIGAVVALVWPLIAVVAIFAAIAGVICSVGVLFVTGVVMTLRFFFFKSRGQ